MRSNIALTVFLFAHGVQAQPAIALSREVEGVKLYRDVAKSNLYYYMPFDYQLVTDTKGRPEFSLVQMRYTGTRVSGDAGENKFHNLLQFRVAVDPGQVQKLTRIRAELAKQLASPELRPLPVRKFSSVLVFAGTADTMSGEDSIRMLRTSSEMTDVESDPNNSYWTDRTITLRLSNEDAQLIESALQNRSSAISFSYAVFTVFSETAPNDLEVYGNQKLRKKVRDYFSEEIRNARDSALKVTMVKADAIRLDPDPAQWADLIQKVDINEKLPAKYPLFDVYCYDFNNSLRADLFAKKIEIRATSVNGAEISTQYSFRASRPDTYSYGIRFPYAVRFDQPFFYRVTEINVDGDITQGPWLEKKEWSEILDITTPAGRPPVRDEEK